MHLRTFVLLFLKTADCKLKNVDIHVAKAFHKPKQKRRVGEVHTTILRDTHRDPTFVEEAALFRRIYISR